VANVLCKVGVAPPSIILTCGVANVAAELSIPSVTITAARNGTHKPGSLHYKDAALDIRTKSLSTTVLGELFIRLRQKFPPPTYDVLLESSGTPNAHIHLEDNRANSKSRARGRPRASRRSP
jgi:hypothetical protein